MDADIAHLVNDDDWAREAVAAMLLRVQKMVVTEYLRLSAQHLGIADRARK